MRFEFTLRALWDSKRLVARLARQDISSNLRRKSDGTFSVEGTLRQPAVLVEGIATGLRVQSFEVKEG